MRALYFLPFTFLAGVDGFGLFAPYMALVFALLALVRLAQRVRAATVMVVPLSLSSDVQPESAALAIQ